MNPRIFVLALSTFSFGSGALIFSGLLEQLAADLGVSAGVAGQLQTVYVLTAALAGPPLAMLVGKLDRKRVLMGALVAAVVLNLICMALSEFGGIIVFRALLGAMAAMAGPAASAAASALSPPERRASALAVVSSGMTVAFLMGIPMGSIIGSVLGWRACFGLAAGLSAFALVGVTVLLPRVKAPAPQLGGNLTWSAAPLFATTMMAFAANMTITTYIAPILRLQADVTGAWVAAFQVLVGVGSIVGLTWGGRAGDRGLAEVSILASFAGMVIAALLHFSALVHATPPGWPTYVLVALAVLCGSASLFSVMPVISSRLSLAAPNAMPLAFSLNGSSASLGQAVGAALGGWLLTTFNGPANPLGTVAIALAALALWRLTAGRPAPKVAATGEDSDTPGEAYAAGAAAAVPATLTAADAAALKGVTPEER